jgi:hypothetical protein
MGTIATATELWCAVGTTIACFLFLIGPGLVLTYLLIERFIDRGSYERAIREVQRSIERR